MLNQIVTTVLDKIELLIGPLMTISGWFFAYKVNLSEFKYQFKKEEYQKLKDSFIYINKLFFQFFKYVHGFINEAQIRTLRGII
jgi:hypothetical protein